MSRQSPQQVVVRRERSRRHAGDPDRRLLASLLFLSGSAFALIGVTDLALLWIPAHLESLSWEFATVGRTLDGLPMMTLGLVLAAYGAYRHPRMSDRGRRVFAILFALLTIFILVVAVLFATSAPAVLRDAPAGAAEALRRASLKHLAQSVVYPIAFGWIALILWRGSRTGD